MESDLVVRLLHSEVIKPFLKDWVRSLKESIVIKEHIWPLWSLGSSLPHMPFLLRHLLCCNGVGGYHRLDASTMLFGISSDQNHETYKV